MLNWRPASPALYNDIQTRNHFARSNPKKPLEKRLRWLWRSSRDSARTPVQWDDSKNAGFTTGTPWLPVNENYREINAAAEERDPDSLLHFYRKAIALRKALPAVRDGEYREYFRLSSKLYVYSRQTDAQKLLVICSFADTDTKIRAPRGFDLNSGKLILQSHTDISDSSLMPYESRVYLWE